MYSIDVSIIIVSWNSKGFLLECLESLGAESQAGNMDIIVVDNASTDGSQGSMKEKFPSVKLIQNKTNLGFAKANNIGIRESRGRYICLMNSDIKVLGNCIDRLYKYMEQHPSIGIVGPKLLNPDLTLQTSCKKFPSLWNALCEAIGLHRILGRFRVFSGNEMHFFAHDSIQRVDAIAGAFLMARRDAIEKIGLLDEDFFFYAEDIDWCKRFWNGGWEIVFFPDAVAIHYGGGSSSLEPNRLAKERVRAIIKYWRKHHNWAERVGLFIIILFHEALRIILRGFIYYLKPSKRTETVKQIEKDIACMRSLFEIRSLK
jgi:GT2 family glycosyltransferase